MASEPQARRPIATRDTGFARWATRQMLRTPLTPNQVSVISVAFAGLGALLLVAWPSAPAALILAALCIQLRLMCNLLDGMMAVEGGRGSPVGALYNEVPDRVADSLLIVALGYAAGAGWLGWAGALAAALTAYIRVFGGALGQKQDFRGPQSKSQRMAVLTGACLLAAVESWLGLGPVVLLAAAWVIMLGSVLTCALRLRAIAAQLAPA